MTARRTAKTFTIDRELHTYVLRTRGKASASQRLNELLRRGIEKEREARLEREAAAFFAAPPETERREARALQKATRRTLARD